MTTETLPFQAEVKNVLHLVVNSLYTHKEIFLRELISNASDALDRIHFRALTEHDLLGEGEKLEIHIVPDPDKRTLTISDNGIGMSREELIENLGTIARSGTQRFLEALEKNADDLKLIGQFGVGFYSAFLVAEKVEVLSRAVGAQEAWRWSSDSQSSFAIGADQRAGRGTDVILHLAKDQDEYLDDWQLRRLVREYSDFVPHPILLHAKKNKPVKEDGSVDEEAPEEREDQLVNKASALWRRPRAEITEEEYEEFYKHLTHGWEAPLARTHFQVEGLQAFTGLLYVPGRAPLDLYSGESHGIRLFVRRVFVSDDCKEVLPEYLRFLRGLVDSDDLPLNVSRETLQYDRVTTTIRKQVAKKALELLETVASGEYEAKESAAEEGADERPLYEQIWEAFGAVLKEGLHSDPENRERLTELLRFRSTASAGWTSLAEYVRRMPAGQEKIYYIAGDNLAALRQSPHIEALLGQGYEVLLLTDGIDEFVIPLIGKYADRELVSATQGEIPLADSDEQPEEKKKEDDARSAELGSLIGKIGEVLGERVQEVRPSRRLTDSPCCLVAGEGQLSARMERILKLQDRSFEATKRIFEVNPEHELIRNMKHLLEQGGQEQRFKDWTLLLYDQALLAEGTPIANPAAFARRVTALLTEASKG